MPSAHASAGGADLSWVRFFLLHARSGWWRRRYLGPILGSHESDPTNLGVIPQTATKGSVPRWFVCAASGQRRGRKQQEIYCGAVAEHDSSQR